MTAAHPAVLAVEVALREVGDALAGADLERLLAAESGLTAALGDLTVISRLEESGTPALREAIDRTYAELLRCRRLGNGLQTYTRATLESLGAGGYSRTGVTPVAVPGGSLETRG